ncbi:MULTISPECIES: ABC transporter ATP-binding protein [unclassified Anabaena]|uniref:ABC transporter ATP-binding protein n=1 Tax=unclassified Anabaena TaxID=2619674 RepID=UPI0008332247|nr:MULTISPECIES: ABC transporter ATP-binding protein [unclassified Anabaena]
MQLGKLFQAKLKKTLRLVPALRLVWQSSPRLTIARVVLVFIQGILPVLSIYLTKLIIDTVVANFSIANKAAAFNSVIPLILLAGGVTLLTNLCYSVTELVITAHSQRVTDYMQGIINAKSIESDLEYYENPLYYDTLQRAQQEAPYRPPQILNRLAQVAQSSVSLIAMVGLLLSLHWGIIGILFVAALPALLVRVKFSRVMYRWQRKWTPSERQAMYLAWMLTSDQYAKEIRLFDIGGYFSQWYQRIRQQLYKEKVAVLSKRSLAFFGAEAIAGIIIFVIYAFIIYQAINGVLRLGDLVLYYQALQKGQNDIKALLASISALYEDNLFLANLYEFLDIKPRIVDSINPVPLPRPMQSGIEFQNVSFQYSTTTRQALKDINLRVGPGEVIALVGENGSGKTTLIKLLCRLYDPTGGKITIDGIDLKEYKTAELRREISVIFQDYAKYHFTAQENIWLANIDLPPQRESIIAAARRSGADDVISKLPKGYDTVLGKLFEEGEELSIGQWQKVALARAFLRDSQLIVLDEPTSAMDPKAEYEVFDKFRQLIKDQAAILISHRLSTVKMADRIYVMDNGTIVESGTHDELMQMNGTYAYLFETQAQQYLM